MRITSSHISTWATENQKEAQQSLPALIRRLCAAASGVHSIRFPSGDATILAGWDGVIENGSSHRFIPSGQSRWEIGCSKDFKAKATQDYDKRTGKIDEVIASKASFVFVTPFCWPSDTKEKWEQERTEKGPWREVRIIDGVDLENWLEDVPHVALEFGEQIGVMGPGVQSISAFWKDWAGQLEPEPTLHSFLRGREKAAEALRNRALDLQSPPTIEFLQVRADTTLESVLFSVAAFIESDFADRALVVTDNAGWSFVEKNEHVELAIAKTQDVARQAPYRSGICVIEPENRADQAPKSENRVSVLRQEEREFEAALGEMGIDEVEAEQLSLQSGRSWSVISRLLSKNAARRRPEWLLSEDPVILSLLALIDQWDGNNESDCRCIASLTGRDYLSVETELEKLSLIEDSPVFRVGSIWKTRAPLELLSLCAPKISDRMLGRFFEEATKVLNELRNVGEEDCLWTDLAAYSDEGYSVSLRRSVADAMVRLSARFDDANGRSTKAVERTVDSIVSHLLSGMDRKTWFSLSHVLPALAEASPKSFLNCLERSLGNEAESPQCLFDATNWGRCWHADLLRAMEILAWSPDNLPRVVRLLARMADWRIGGNWVHSPQNSLNEILRCWAPQTSADLTERQQMLELLSREYPEVAIGLVCSILFIGGQSGIPGARPKWREDAYGGRIFASEGEINAMRQVAEDIALRLAATRPSMIGRLLQETVFRFPLYARKLLPIVQGYAEDSVPDEQREQVREAIRKWIHFQRNFYPDDSPEQAEVIEQMTVASEELEPADLIIRFRWLFSDSPPILIKDGSGPSFWISRLIVPRLQALHRIHEQLGFAGIERFLDHPDVSAAKVGDTLAILLRTIPDKIGDWIIESSDHYSRKTKIGQAISGLFGGYRSSRIDRLREYVLQYGRQSEWADATTVKFLTLLPLRPETWRMLSGLEEEVELEYWRRLDQIYCDSEEELHLATEKLLAVARPYVALKTNYYSDLRHSRASQLVEALVAILHTEEPEKDSFPDTYLLIEVFIRIAESGEVPESKLVSLQFVYYSVLANGPRAATAALMKRAAADPEFFVQLVSNMGPKDPDWRSELPLEQEQVFANSRRILRRLETIGIDASSKRPEEEQLKSFLSEVMRLAKERGCLDRAEREVGAILGRQYRRHTGHWPMPILADFLETAVSEDLRHGFFGGILESLGVSMRSPTAGGAQERGIEEDFRRLSAHYRISHPRFCRLLDSVADIYARQAEHEDLSAKMLIEGVY
ncbi:MAG: hypothetical protein CMN76_00135 [Spirochaetaceae bacterium]|nr:hypothetical protein [Spirochaetaceae bacterium]|tara:strand:+ start:4658 stop:8428 length:3771 start_codon:yes stop_codon:yes gene_type:complete